MSPEILILLLGIFAAVAAGSLASKRIRRRWTEQLALTQSLRASEQRLRQFSAQLPTVLFQFQAPSPGVSPGRFVYLSDAADKVLPLSAVQLLEDPARLLPWIPENDRECFCWLDGKSPCPPRIDWVGQLSGAIPTKELSAGKWLQLRGNADISPNGNLILTGIIADISDLMHAQHELAESEIALRQLAAHREDERESDYRRLGREFHDELGQLLTAARLRLQVLKNDDGDAFSERIKAIDHLLADACRSVKTIAAELRPPALNYGLVAAIEWQAERAFHHAGIGFTFVLRPSKCATDKTDQLSERVQTALFRIAQEAFTNVLRYANAHTVHVSLQLDADQLGLEIADDGCGFDPHTVDTHRHFGLAGMRERALAMCGSLEIDSAPGEGTRICVRIPMT